MSVCVGQGGWRDLGAQRGLSHEMDEVCTAGYNIKEGDFEPICSSFPFMAEDRVAIALWLSLSLPLCLIDSAARFKSQLKTQLFLLLYNSSSTSLCYYF